MEGEKIAEFFRHKGILITGSTGFLGTVLVEKILRVQPDVKKLYLLVRATEAATARQRIKKVLEKDIFKVLKEKHGEGFHAYMEEKLCPVSGDVIYAKLGIQDPILQELIDGIDIIVNIAATTNFYERYDVALEVNALGPKNVCEFAKECPKLQLLMHVSTAYVAGEQKGLIQEKSFKMGETLKECLHLDIEAELTLVKELNEEVRTSSSTEDRTKKTMKELGRSRARHFGWPNTYVFTKAMGEMLLGDSRGEIPVVIIRPAIVTSIYNDPLPGWIEGTRTIDSVIMAYARQNLPCFIGDLHAIMDVIPGDMVVNAMMVAMVTHSDKASETIYHVGSSMRNPMPLSTIDSSTFRYFTANPSIGKDGRKIAARRTYFFQNLESFQIYMTIKYGVPLEIFSLANWVLCGMFSRSYNQLKRRYRYVMNLVDFYAPYVFFKGCFDDMNLERLRAQMHKYHDEATFGIDPKIVVWEDYLYNIHIPGLLKYAVN